jgi:hypothetical protein
MMKAIAGGAWLTGLMAMAFGAYIITILLTIIGALAVASDWYEGTLQERQSNIWRTDYPNYKY